MLHEKNLTWNLQATRARFVARVSGWIPAFEAAGADWEKGVLQDADLSGLRMQAHKIAGSAQIFGFAGLSRLAAELEDELECAIGDDRPKSAPASLLCAIENFAVAARQMCITVGADVEAGDEANERLAPLELAWDLVEPDQPESVPCQTRPPHILVVDDDDLMREAIVGGLSPNGWTFAEAVDGQDAIERLFLNYGSRSDPRPDLILLDVDMPRKDGFETLRLLKSSRQWKSTPTIMLTHRDTDVDLVSGIASGAHDYVTKPFEFDVLARKITDTFAATTSQVLLAVADRTTRNELLDGLQVLPIDVRCATDPKQAVDMLSDGTTELAVIDDGFPKLGGSSLVELMQADDDMRLIPIMSLHAEGDRESMIGCLSDGAHDGMTQPFDDRELMARIKGILQRASL